jgi:hypothetical protein
MTSFLRLYTALHLIYTCIYENLQGAKTDTPPPCRLNVFLHYLIVYYLKLQNPLFERIRQLRLQGSPLTSTVPLCNFTAI